MNANNLAFLNFWVLIERRVICFCFTIAVVNLTLIDLPGLTKVAVGECFSIYFRFIITLKTTTLILL